MTFSGFINNVFSSFKKTFANISQYYYEFTLLLAQFFVLHYKNSVYLLNNLIGL